VRIGQDGSRNAVRKGVDPARVPHLDDSWNSARATSGGAPKAAQVRARRAPEELDLDTTIDKTARNAGVLDLSMRPERHNAVRC